MPDDPRVVELGRATTHGQALPLGSDDAVIAARAVRRALAAAGNHAPQVTGLLIATREPVTADVCLAFARRALGPHGATIATGSLVSDAGDAVRLAEQAGRAALAGMDRTGLAIAVGLAPDGDVVALCLGFVATSPPV